MHLICENRMNYYSILTFFFHPAMITHRKEVITMDDSAVVAIIKSKNANTISLLQALTIVRQRIDNCIHCNKDLLSDPLLAKVLLRRNN